ncbi:MAG: hypothetical protein F4213_18750 [Boseongicola sp. SB0677_bin_26]|nr:hypothetical protein [Boseongicola sp. SB0665_bin_10]MYG28030.1 hypothetical protein [Boseongicola sp. SB0677_bin_26]
MSADRGRWHAAGSGGFREGVAGAAGPIAELDTSFANPWAEDGDRRERLAILLSGMPMQALLLLAASFGATAAVLLLLGVFGPEIVAALAPPGRSGP